MILAARWSTAIARARSAAARSAKTLPTITATLIACEISNVGVIVKLSKT
jgi:hypothetical protein